MALHSTNLLTFVLSSRLYKWTWNGIALIL